MNRVVGIWILVAGVLATVVGAFLQAGGAAAVLYYSLLGAGFLLMVAGFVLWALAAWSHRPPTATAV